MHSDRHSADRIPFLPPGQRWPVQNDAVENDAVENDAVENDAVENDAVNDESGTFQITEGSLDRTVERRVGIDHVTELCGGNFCVDREYEQFEDLTSPWPRRCGADKHAPIGILDELYEAVVSGL